MTTPSPARCQAAASGHRRRADRARRRDGDAGRTRSRRRRRDGGLAWHSRCCRLGLQQPLSFLGDARLVRKAAAGGGIATGYSPVTRLASIFPVSRICPPFHQTAEWWRPPRRGRQRRQLFFVQLIAGGAPLQITRNSSRSPVPPLVASLSSMLYFRPPYRGPSRGASGRSRRLAACHGGSSAAWEVPTSARRYGRLAFFRLAKEGIQLVTAPTAASSTWSPSSRPRLTTYPAGRPTPAGLPFSGETASGSTCSRRRQQEANRAS